MILVCGSSPVGVILEETLIKLNCFFTEIKRVYYNFLTEMSVLSGEAMSVNKHVCSSQEERSKTCCAIIVQRRHCSSYDYKTLEAEHRCSAFAHWS